MGELRLTVPTYNGTAFPSATERGEIEEYGPPKVPVLIRSEGGVRILLGTHDRDDPDRPDILIERRPNGWAIFLHPDGSGDPSGCVYFLDNGESIVVPELLGVMPSIEVRSPDGQIPKEIDQPPT